MFLFTHNSFTETKSCLVELNTDILTGTEESHDDVLQKLSLFLSFFFPFFCFIAICCHLV